MTVIEQEDTNAQKQNAAFVHSDRRNRNSMNASKWSTLTLSLSEELYALVQAAYWETTYKPNINEKAITVKVNNGQYAQVDTGAIAALKAFVERHNVVERVRNKHRFFDIVK